MTRVAVFSDSHGNIELLSKALATAKKHSIDKVYHLGDNYEDAQTLQKEKLEVLRVPGIFHPLYKTKQVPRKLRDHVEELDILLLHDENDLSDKEVAASDVILVGHTHRLEIRLDAHRAVVNPGQLKAPLNKGRPAAWAILEIEGRTCQIKILTPDDTVVAEATYNKPDVK